MNELCTWSRERLARYLDNELDAPERARLDEHLAACADCRSALAALRAGDELARDASGATSADEEQSFDAWLQAFTSRQDLESAARLRSEEMAADEAAGRAGREFLTAEEIAARPLEPELRRGERGESAAAREPARAGLRERVTRLFASHPAWRWARIAIPAAAAAVVVVVLLVREPGLPERAMEPMVSIKQRISEPARDLGAAPAANERRSEGAAEATHEPAAKPAPAPVAAPPPPAAPPDERSRTIRPRDTKMVEGLKSLPASDLIKSLRATDSGHEEIGSFAPKTAGAAPLTHTAGDQRVLFYFHGQIVEDQGRLAVSDRYGPYEYDAILGALRAGGYTVISEVRPKGTDPLVYAHKVVGQIDSLKAAGVPSDHITVVGASMGGFIAVYVADLLRDEAINYVLLAICAEDSLRAWAARDICPVGRMLSIYDASDQSAATCDPLFNRCASFITERREIALDLGVGHGLVYKPLKEWVEPTLEWGRR